MLAPDHHLGVEDDEEAEDDGTQAGVHQVKDTILSYVHCKQIDKGKQIGNKRYMIQ